MNQSQIEILIKLRNEADAGLARLSEHIKRTTSDFTGMATGADRATDALDKRLRPAGVATGVVMGNLATMAGQKVYQAFTQTIGAANRLDSALIGLASVAKHMGEDVDGAKAAAVSLASDGLMSVSDAAASLKNLLSSGLSLEQSINLMNRLKESATFNRQAHYELGGAVVATTEGIKNGNSVLADASGVTKNLSVMLKEAGISIDKVGDAQKDGSYQAAIYNGFMRETEGSVGNVTKYLDTAAGKQAQFSAAVLTTQQAIGQKLQPVIGAMLDTMMPLVEVIGDNAGALVPLGMAVGTVVAPLILMNTASRLNLGSLSKLTDQASTLWTTFQKVNASSFGGFLPGLRTVGAEAGITTASLGKLGTAAAIAGTAFAGWQIGRAISDLLDLDEKINRVVNNLDLLDPARMAAARGQASAMAMLAAAEEKVATARRLHGASAARTAEIELEILRNDPVILQMKEQIAKAIQNGARANITYAEAVKHNADVEAVRLAAMNRSAAVVDANAAREEKAARLSFQYMRQTGDTTAARLKEIDVQMAGIAAEERLGRISSQTAAERRLAYEEEKKGLTVRQSMVAISTVTAEMEKRVNAEIAATGRTMGALVGELESNEAGFRAWAKQVDLSSETVKTIEARLKAKTAAVEKAKKENEEYRKSIEDVRASLEKWGLIGTPAVERELRELDAMVNQAKADNIAYSSVITSMVIPALEALQAKAKTSGIESAAITRRLEEARGVALMARLAHTATLPPLPVVTQFNEAYFRSLGLMGQGVDIMGESRREAILSAKAMEYFGLSSRDELEETARASRAHYEQLLKMGTATPEQIKKAHAQMVEDMNAASGKVPSFWQREVVPGVTRSVEMLRTAVSGSFAQMLMGAKGFGDGFVDIWEAIKSSVLNIFNQITAAFLDKVLGSILNALKGGGGSFQASLFGGASRALPAIAAGGVPTAALAVPNLIGMGRGGGSMIAPTTAGGGFLASGAAGVLGGGAAAVGGFMLGRDLTGRFGRTAGAAGGAAGGAATGALIGSVIPGLGTGVGAVVGGLAGLAGGLLGQSKGQKEDKAANLEIANVRAELLKTYGSLDNIRTIGKQVGVDLAGAFGHQGKRGLEQFMATIEQFETKQRGLQDAIERHGIEWTDLGVEAQKSHIFKATDALLGDLKLIEGSGVDGTAALKRMAPAFNELLAGIMTANQKIPAELAPHLEKMAELGLISVENMKRLRGEPVGDLADWRAMEAAAKDLGVDVDKLGTAFEQSKMNDLAGELAGKFELLKKHTGDYGDLLNNTADEAQDFYDRAKKYNLEIPDSMRPMLDEMVKAGLLIDENGDKLEDLSDVKFAAPVKSEASLIVDAIKELTDLFRNGLPNAVGDGVAEAQRRLQSGDWSVGVDVRARPVGPGSVGEVIDVLGAANGIYASSPTFRVFAEREPELGGPVSFMSRALAGALERVPALPGVGGPMSIEAVASDVVLNGEKLGRIVFEFAIKDGRRRGVVKG